MTAAVVRDVTDIIDYVGSRVHCQLSSTWPCLQCEHTCGCTDIYKYVYKDHDCTTIKLGIDLSIKIYSVIVRPLFFLCVYNTNTAVDHKRVTDQTNKVVVAFCGASGCKFLLSLCTNFVCTFTTPFSKMRPSQSSVQLSGEWHHMR